eukprot:s2462_g6.t1
MAHARSRDGDATSRVHPRNPPLSGRLDEASTAGDCERLGSLPPKRQIEPSPFFPAQALNYLYAGIRLQPWVDLFEKVPNSSRAGPPIMEDCEVRDDWSRMCSPVLSTELIQFFSVCFCAMVALIVVLWALYAACLSQMGRPMFRVWSFTLATLGFVLSTPQAFVRIKDPSLLPTEDAVLLTSFVLGDVMNHIALLMIIYWDICRESVMLIFALDPAKQTKSLRLSFGVGSGFMLSQVAILGTFLPLMAFLEDTSRGLTISIFYVGQVSFIFGFAPPVAFGLLARSLQKLWAELPPDLPRRLAHRLRYAQSGLYLLLLVCLVYAPCGLFPAIIPELNDLGGFIYTYIVMLAAAGVVVLLLVGELTLTLKQLRSKARQTQPLAAEQMVKIARAGAESLRCREDRPHGVYTPVWQRGLEHSIIQGFLELAAEGLSESAIKTNEVCQRHVRPLTAPARCSAWEALGAGWDSLTMDAHRHHLSQHLNTPTVMVSHCWASPFQDVVKIMGRYDENTNKSNFFFFDVFSMNQHDLSDLSGPDRKDQPGQDLYDVMLEALTNSIRTPRRVLLALTPHHEPQLLSRSWCLYEIYMAWKLKAEVSCGFVPAGEQMVIQSLQEGDALIEHMLSRVDAEKSQATVESDRLMILELIKKDGVSKFNQFVRQKFAASLRVVALTTVPSTASADMLDWAPDLPERTLSCDTRSHFARQISLESTVDESVRHIREIFRVWFQYRSHCCI